MVDTDEQNEYGINEYSGDVSDWTVLDNFEDDMDDPHPPVDRRTLDEVPQQERRGIRMGDRGFTNWVRCPSCKSTNVAAWADYDRAIGFVCRSCGRYDQPSHGGELHD